VIHARSRQSSGRNHLSGSGDTSKWPGLFAPIDVSGVSQEESAQAKEGAPGTWRAVFHVSDFIFRVRNQHDAIRP
jgi:hypothetical protein